MQRLVYEGVGLGLYLARKIIMEQGRLHKSKPMGKERKHIQHISQEEIGTNRLIRVNLRRLNAFVPFVQLFRDSMKIEDKFSEYA